MQSQEGIGHQNPCLLQNKLISVRHSTTFSQHIHNKPLYQRQMMNRIISMLLYEKYAKH